MEYPFYVSGIGGASGGSIAYSNQYDLALYWVSYFLDTEALSDSRARIYCDFGAKIDITDQVEEAFGQSLHVYIDEETGEELPVERDADFDWISTLEAIFFHEG